MSDDWPLKSGWVRWPKTNEHYPYHDYVNGAGCDGDIYKSLEETEGVLWVTCSEYTHHFIPYIPGEEVNYPLSAAPTAHDDDGEG